MKPRVGYLCRKCWLKVETFHLFYVRIEQIQGICYKTETIDQIKYDLPPCTDAPDPNINYDESQMPESGAEDGFDDLSVDNFTDGILMTIKTKIIYNIQIPDYQNIYRLGWSKRNRAAGN